MSRKTSMQLGPEDVADLQAAVDEALLTWRTEAPTSFERADGYRRYLKLRERLNNAARRLEGTAHGRGGAAR